MKNTGIISFIFISLIFLFSFSGAETVSVQSYSSAQARTIINQSIAYLNNINESGYLFFNPNLAQAYTYLNRSIELENSSPNTAIAYAYQAENSANTAFGRIDAYREYALVGVVAFTIIFGLFLYRLVFKKDDTVRPQRKKR